MAVALVRRLVRRAFASCRELDLRPTVTEGLFGAVADVPV
jgi:hypothetical protein